MKHVNEILHKAVSVSSKSISDSTGAASLVYNNLQVKTNMIVRVLGMARDVLRKR